MLSQKSSVEHETELITQHDHVLDANTISTRKSKGNLIRQLERCFCLGVDLKENPRETQFTVTPSELTCVSGKQNCIHNMLQEGDVPSRSGENHTRNIKRHFCTAQFGACIENNKLAREAQPDCVHSACPGGIGDVDRECKHHPDCLDSIITAVEEVASASKMLSSALQGLKHYSNSDLMDIMRLKDRALDMKTRQKISERVSLDIEATMSADNHSEIVTELPAMGEVCHVEPHRTVLQDDLFHQAVSDIRICFEDMDAVEPVHYTSQNDPPIERNVKPSGQLLIPQTDSCAKSPYPDTRGPSSGLTFTIPVDSKPIDLSNNLALRERRSHGHTMMTGTFQLLSSEETQVTEVDDGLTTDESRTSSRATDQLRNSACPPSGYIPSRIIPDPCVRQNLPKPVVKSLSPHVTRTIQTFSDDLHSFTEDQLGPIGELSHFNGASPVNVPERCMTEPFLRDKNTSKCVNRLSTTESQRIMSDSQNHNQGRLLTSKPFAVDPSRPCPVVLDNDDLSFEVMYQRNNHSQKSPLMEAMPADHRSGGNSSENSVRHLIEAFSILSNACNLQPSPKCPESESAVVDSQQNDKKRDENPVSQSTGVVDKFAERSLSRGSDTGLQTGSGDEERFRLARHIATLLGNDLEPPSKNLPVVLESE